MTTDGGRTWGSIGGGDARRESDTTPFQRVLRGHRGETRCGVFSRCGRAVVIGGRDGQLIVFDADTAEPWRVWTSRSGVGAVAMSPTDPWVAFGDDAGFVWVHDWLSGAAVAGPLEVDAEVTAMAFSPGGRLLAVGGAQHRVALIDMRGFGTRILGGLHNSRVTGVAFAPGGRLLYSVGADRRVNAVDVVSGRAVATHALEAEAHAVAVHPSGVVVVGARDGGVYVLAGDDLHDLGAIHADPPRTASGIELAPVDLTAIRAGAGVQAQIPDHPALVRNCGRAGPVTALSFDGEGAILAVAHAGGRMRFLRVPNAEAEADDSAAPLTLVGEWPVEETVAAVAFDPDGSQWLSVGQAPVARLWMGHPGMAGAEERALLIPDPIPPAEADELINELRRRTRFDSLPLGLAKLFGGGDETLKAMREQWETIQANRLRFNHATLLPLDALNRRYWALRQASRAVHELAASQPAAQAERIIVKARDLRGAADPLEKTMFSLRAARRSHAMAGEAFAQSLLSQLKRLFQLRQVPQIGPASDLDRRAVNAALARSAQALHGLGESARGLEVEVLARMESALGLNTDQPLAGAAMDQAVERIARESARLDQFSRHLHKVGQRVHRLDR